MLSLVLFQIVKTMSTLELKVYEIFKSKFSEQDATTVIEYFESKTEQKILQKKDIFLTKDDKVELIKTIYIVGIVQFLAIVGSVLLIISYMIRK